MLRLAVVLLLLANAGYYAWTQGLLREWGLAPVDESEPQRLQQQIAPNNLRLLPPQRAPGDVGTQAALAAAPASTPAAAALAAAPESAASASATSPDSAPDSAPASTPASAPASAPAAPAPTNAASAANTSRSADQGEPRVCLQAGVFDADQAQSLRQAAASLPGGSWALEPTTIPGRWMVYMGRFADEDALARKRAELRALKIAYDRPAAALEPGLSLGRFSTEEAAQRGLALLVGQGVRTARVVQERTDAPGFTLRLPAVAQSQRARVQATLAPALAGKTLRPCSS